MPYATFGRFEFRVPVAADTEAILTFTVRQQF
mgnify:CR=1 FL=1